MTSSFAPTPSYTPYRRTSNYRTSSSLRSPTSPIWPITPRTANAFSSGTMTTSTPYSASYASFSTPRSAGFSPSYGGRTPSRVGSDFGAGGGGANSIKTPHPFLPPPYTPPPFKAFSNTPYEELRSLSRSYLASIDIRLPSSHTSHTKSGGSSAGGTRTMSAQYVATRMEELREDLESELEAMLEESTRGIVRLAVESRRDEVGGGEGDGDGSSLKKRRRSSIRLSLGSRAELARALREEAASPSSSSRSSSSRTPYSPVSSIDDEDERQRREDKEEEERWMKEKKRLSWATEVFFKDRFESLDEYMAKLDGLVWLEMQWTRRNSIATTTGSSARGRRSSTGRGVGLEDGEVDREGEVALRMWACEGTLRRMQDKMRAAMREGLKDFDG